MSNDNKFNRFSNTILKDNAIILEKSSMLFKQFINITMIVLALAVIGCFDFVNFTFSVEILKTPQYWIHLCMRAVILILMYNSGINVFWDKFIQSNITLNEYKRQYEEKNKLRDTNFEYFIESVLNPKIKKEAYLAHIKKKLYLLDKFSKDYDKLLFSSELPERQEEKLKNKYCIRKQKLLDLMSDDYVDSQLEYIKVRYQRVDASVFCMDINGEATVSNYKVKSSVGKTKSQKTAKGLVSMMIISIFISSILLDPNFKELLQDMTYVINAIVNMILDLLFSAWQLFKGVMDAPKIINQEYTIAYANRSKILDQYILWNANNTESKAYKITKYIEQSEVKTNE